MKIYHVGVLRHNRTAIIQMCKDVDSLSCEILEYFGERETTKAKIINNKDLLLSALRTQYPSKFGNCIYIRVQ